MEAFSSISIYPYVMVWAKLTSQFQICFFFFGKLRYIFTWTFCQITAWRSYLQTAFHVLVKLRMLLSGRAHVLLIWAGHSFTGAPHAVPASYLPLKHHTACDLSGAPLSSSYLGSWRAWVRAWVLRSRRETTPESPSLPAHAWRVKVSKLPG